MALINGLVQDCSNSSANALELLQSCTKPLIDITYEKTTLKKKNINNFVVAMVPVDRLTQINTQFIYMCNAWPS